MEIFEATVTSKGQVTIPAKLRSALGVKSGDKLIFRREEDGGFHLSARTGSLADLIGVVRSGPAGIDAEAVSAWLERSGGARWPAGDA